MKKTILIVDDDVNILEVLEKFFEKLGLNTILARNGKEGLELFSTNHVDLIISDLKMPIMQGDAFFSEIREIDPDIPFFLLTGFIDHTSINILLDMEITEIIEKPIKLEKIEEIIRPYL